MSAMTIPAGEAFTTFERGLKALMVERSPERIADKLQPGAWIHGAGGYGRLLAGLLADKGFSVLGFIDRRAGRDLDTLDDLPVLHPDAITADQARGKAFVGGVMNPRAASNDMLPWVRGLPFGAVAAGADLPDLLGDQANTVWQSSRAFLLQHLDRLAAVAARLSDQASLDVLMGLLAYRATNMPEAHPEADVRNQYLPKDLPGFEEPIVFVDGGAYVGDSCEHLLRQGIAVSRYVAFEPDAANLEKLAGFIRQAPIPESTVIPCGLADGFRELHFLASQGASSRVVAAELATTTIRCVAFDDVIAGVRPDFVKLDVEGFELAALNGMAATIAAARPRIAACLYHKPEDLWEVPEWIAARYDRLHIRQHGRYGIETVLYALP